MTRLSGYRFQAANQNTGRKRDLSALAEDVRRKQYSLDNGYKPILNPAFH
jgi:hypothetical protein